MMQPQITYDLFNEYGNDLVLAAGNDLQNASEVIKSNQRITRRLLTNPGDYIWHPTYGAGLPAFVGQPLSNDVYTQIQSTIMSQIFMEDSVAKTPSPIITIQTIQNGLLVQINYTVNPIGQPVVLTFIVE